MCVMVHAMPCHRINNNIYTHYSIILLSSLLFIHVLYGIMVSYMNGVTPYTLRLRTLLPLPYVYLNINVYEYGVLLFDGYGIVKVSPYQSQFMYE